MNFFKFNFGQDNVEVESTVKEAKIHCSDVCSEHEWSEEKVLQTEQSIERASILFVEDVEIKHLYEPLKFNDNKDLGTETSVNIAEQSHSDLVPGVYEGGLKIWECTHDLLSYILKEVDPVWLQNADVMDLGCGAGILGFATIMAGALSLVSQDYNYEVIEQLTIPNAILNLWDESESFNKLKKCRFFSGDWKAFHEKLNPNDKFDLILTAETIYNVENYAKLIKIFKERLKENGRILLAAKTCYFGVGGGIRQFEKAIAEEGSLESMVLCKTDKGIKREILLLTHSVIATVSTDEEVIEELTLLNKTKSMISRTVSEAVSFFKSLPSEISDEDVKEGQEKELKTPINKSQPSATI